jgi:hypothetical protein
LEEVITAHRVDRAILAYSDISYDDAMALAARVRAAGAAFELLAWCAGALRCPKPVVAVTATRTGCGKSQVRVTAARGYSRGAPCAWCDAIPTHPPVFPPPCPSLQSQCRARRVLRIQKTRSRGPPPAHRWISAKA